MDREKLFRHLEQRYTSKRDMISRIPLGTQPDALWQELLNQRRSRSTVLPLYNYKGLPYWFVTTDKMVAASERVVGALYEIETEFDPYTEALPVSTLEEVFYTSYVEGSQISIQAAMDFLTSDLPPRDIEEQMIANNRQAANYASGNLYRPIDAEYLKELVYLLTDGMDQGGQDYRSTNEVDFTPTSGEAFAFPSVRTIPDRLGELSAFLELPNTHPLVKAAVAQAYLMILRPFPEGNDRLGRMVSNIILLRAGYTFFSEISLSALIARRSYSYYEAMLNILREENGCDLTYFIEYYLELLSRAVEERRLRQRQKEERSRQEEMALARTPLMAAAAPAPDPTPPDSGRPAPPEPETAQTSEVPTEADPSYDYSFPLIHQMWVVSLHCWEIIRATLAVATSDMRVMLANNPVPPILNNARIEWVSLYLGKQPYRGISRLSEQWTEAEDFDACENDVHLYKVREMETSPLLKRLIDAYEADYPEVDHGKA